MSSRSSHQAMLDEHWVLFTVLQQTVSTKNSTSIKNEYSQLIPPHMFCCTLHFIVQQVLQRLYKVIAAARKWMSQRSSCSLERYGFQTVTHAHTVVKPLTAKGVLHAALFKKFLQALRKVEPTRFYFLQQSQVSQ